MLTLSITVVGEHLRSRAVQSAFCEHASVGEGSVCWGDTEAWDCIDKSFMNSLAVKKDFLDFNGFFNAMT